MYIKLPKDKNIAKMESTTIKRVISITNLFQNKIEQTRELRMQLDLFLKCIYNHPVYIIID